MDNNTTTKLYEISSDVKLLANELRGRGGLLDRLDSLEKTRREFESAYWKGIGIIAGISATSAFIGSVLRALLEKHVR